MEVTAIELDLTPETGDGKETGIGALIGLFFLLVLTALAHWAGTAATDK